MILDVTKKLMPYIVLIALVSMTITWAFGIQNMLIEEQTINGITIKTFDLRRYLVNISNAWESNALNFEDIIPSREWEQVQGTIIDSSFWNSLFNNMALLFDWMYFPINFLLWILRWICWLAMILLSIIGWNTMKDNNGNYYSTLANILNWIITNLMIPYI